MKRERPWKTKNALVPIKRQRRNILCGTTLLAGKMPATQGPPGNGGVPEALTFPSRHDQERSDAGIRLLWEIRIAAPVCAPARNDGDTGFSPLLRGDLRPSPPSASHRSGGSLSGKRGVTRPHPRIFVILPYYLIRSPGDCQGKSGVLPPYFIQTSRKFNSFFPRSVVYSKAILRKHRFGPPAGGPFILESGAPTRVARRLPSEWENRIRKVVFCL